MSIHISDKTFTSRPDTSGRLKKETDTYEFLERLDIPFTGVDHDETAGVEDCAAVEKRLGIVICKNLFLTDPSKENYYLLMMPGEKRFNTSDVSRKLGSKRLSFADGTSMEKYLNIMPGSVSVLGLLFDTDKRVRLLIDRDILSYEYIGCHPCVNTSSLKILLSDLLNLFLPATGHEPTILEL